MDHAIGRPGERDPIEAFVPLDDDEPARRKSGRKKGTPNKPKITAIAVPKETRESTHCVCGQPVGLMSLDLARELVRSSRDKILESTGEVMSAIAVADTLHLAARFDGYCSLGCWRKRQAQG